MGGPFAPGLPSQALRASSPKGGAIGIPRKVNGFARGSPTRGAGGRKPDCEVVWKENLTNAHESDGLGKQKRRRKLFAAKSASCLTRTGDTLINSQVL